MVGHDKDFFLGLALGALEVEVERVFTAFCFVAERKGGHGVALRNGEFVSVHDIAARSAQFKDCGIKGLAGVVGVFLDLDAAHPDGFAWFVERFIGFEEQPVVAAISDGAFDPLGKSAILEL